MYADFGFDIEQDYFAWLCELVHINSIETSYMALAKDLHHRKFYSIVPHDENRASDGKELREEYLREINYPKYIEIEGDCSIFEMLIALAKRMDFETNDPYDIEENVDRTAYWFWEMIDNLGLTKYSDDNYYYYGGSDHIDRILDRFLERRYSRDGNGGIFPLEWTRKDQRDVEIWGQMNAYLAEKEMVG